MDKLKQELDIKQKKKEFLTLFLAKMPKYLKDKRNASFIEHLKKMVTLIEQDAVYKMNDDGVIIISLTKKTKPLRVTGINGPLSIINEYKIKIEGDQVVINIKENTITTNERYISNVTIITNEIYNKSSDSFSRNVLVSNRSNSFPNTRYVLDECIIKESNVSSKYIYNQNWDIIQEWIKFDKPQERNVSKRLGNFLGFAKEPTNDIDAYHEIVYNAVTSRKTKENYIVCISGKKGKKDIMLYKMPLQNVPYNFTTYNVQGKKITPNDVRNIMSSDLSNYVDLSSLIEEPQIKQ